MNVKIGFVNKSLINEAAVFSSTEPLYSQRHFGGDWDCGKVSTGHQEIYRHGLTPWLPRVALWLSANLGLWWVFAQSFQRRSAILVLIAKLYPYGNPICIGQLPIKRCSPRGFRARDKALWNMLPLIKDVSQQQHSCSDEIFMRLN